ncbi:interferon-induced transmembrane protein 3-like [Lethenteron reissneri]|uniref:interferon-induced transmembrane protein 3-like n=1 Tax=Lethenteron reissneri TaxID=7753 RepID=UPI002AB6149A|nr:interferon-induced transmembrane protein 3-like [Lethenteron reissneri]
MGLDVSRPTSRPPKSRVVGGSPSTPSAPPSEGPLNSRVAADKGGGGGDTDVEAATLGTERVRDLLAVSLFSLVYCNCLCLGVVATVLSIKARDRRHVGDTRGAHRVARAAAIFNATAWLAGAVVLCIVGFYVAFIVVVIARSRDTAWASRSGSNGSGSVGTSSLPPGLWDRDEQLIYPGKQ